MNSKSNNNQLATKKDLKVLEGLIKLDMKEAFERHEEKHKEYRDEILTKMDKVMGKLEKMEEENTAGADLIGGLEIKVRDHEERIAKLESPQAA